MQHTAKFTDYQPTWQEPKRKNGRGKFTGTFVEVVDTLTPVSVSYGGVSKIYYTRGKESGKERQTLYNADGSYAKGVWQHGRFGSKAHEESIWLHNGRLCTTSAYASGQIKDQIKYLKFIL